MEFELSKSLEILSTTPAVLDALLRSKSDAWLHARKSPDAFSAIDVVGHLILADRTDWIPRAQVFFEDDGPHPFPPFDRFAFQEIIAAKSIHTLLDEFAATRNKALSDLHALHLAEADLQREALHPQFGRVTLSQLLATWTVHDLNHIQQIVRTLAHEYEDAVGPWTAFLSILN